MSWLLTLPAAAAVGGLAAWVAGRGTVGVALVAGVAWPPQRLSTCSRAGLERGAGASLDQSGHVFFLPRACLLDLVQLGHGDLDRLLRGPCDHDDHGLVRVGILLAMRDERGDKQEVARIGGDAYLL